MRQPSHWATPHAKRAASPAPRPLAQPQGRQAPKPSVPAAAAERGPLSTVVHSAVRRDPPVRLVAEVVRRTAGAVTDTQAVATAERVLGPASAPSQIVRALARDASSVIGSVAEAGETIGGVASSVLDPAVPSLRSLGLVAETAFPARRVPLQAIAAVESPREALAAMTGAQLFPDRLLAQGGASFALANPPLTSQPGPAGARSTPPATPASSVPRTSSRTFGTLHLTGGHGAASSAAHDAPGASLPASPAPTPSSPGGVSPATAVGAGGGIAVALALAALLLLTAPPALRRFGLVAESWRRAPLLLIADRPG